MCTHSVCNTQYYYIKTLQHSIRYKYIAINKTDSNGLRLYLKMTFLNTFNVKLFETSKRNTTNLI